MVPAHHHVSVRTALVVTESRFKLPSAKKGKFCLCN